MEYLKDKVSKVAKDAMFVEINGVKTMILKSGVRLHKTRRHFKRSKEYRWDARVLWPSVRKKR